MASDETITSIVRLANFSIRERSRRGQGQDRQPFDEVEFGIGAEDL